jgi:hypothetical protein
MKVAGRQVLHVDFGFVCGARGVQNLPSLLDGGEILRLL